MGQTRCFALLLAASCACGTARGFLASPGSLRGHRSRPFGLSGARASVCVLREAQGTTAERRVKCIFSDVDGTLLDKQHRLQPDTRAAILEAVAADIPFVMATGKSRGPWIHELRRELGVESPGYGLNGPAVFIQGLLVCDDRGLAVQQLTLPVNPRLFSTPCLWFPLRAKQPLATESPCICHWTPFLVEANDEIEVSLAAQRDSDDEQVCRGAPHRSGCLHHR